MEFRFYEFLDPEYVDVGVEILFYVAYKVRYNYFRFSGRHIVLATSGCTREFQV